MIVVKKKLRSGEEKLTKFIIIQIDPKRLKVSWIYYGGLHVHGLKESKTFGVRSSHFTLLKKICKRLVELILQK